MNRTRYGEIKCMSNTFSNLIGRYAKSFVPPSPPTPHQDFGAHCGPTAWSQLRPALSRDDSVGMMAGLLAGYLGNRGWISRRGPKIMPPRAFRPALETTQPSIESAMGILSPATKRPQREADHLPPLLPMLMARAVPIPAPYPIAFMECTWTYLLLSQLLWITDKDRVPNPKN